MGFVYAMQSLDNGRLGTSAQAIGIARAAYEYAGFSKAARRAGVTVVLGGAGFREEGVRKRLPADLHADSFRQLEEFVGSLAAGES